MIAYKELNYTDLNKVPKFSELKVFFESLLKRIKCFIRLSI